MYMYSLSAVWLCVSLVCASRLPPRLAGSAGWVSACSPWASWLVSLSLGSLGRSCSAYALFFIRCGVNAPAVGGLVAVGVYWPIRRHIHGHFPHVDGSLRWAGSVGRWVGWVVGVVLLGGCFLWLVGLVLSWFAWLGFRFFSGLPWLVLGRRTVAHRKVPLSSCTNVLD